ncbi:MAG: FAD-binding oxidoreductase, partial [Rubrobacter sp.]|nr:FAD-binding oxidoreductase [Rubrobacter sp.]
MEDDIVSAMAHRGFHEVLEECFGNRYKVHPAHGQEADAPMSVVSPANVEEVEFLSELTDHYSVPLILEGAITAPKLRRPPDAIAVRFDLMREVSVPQPPDYLVEVQPGIPWLQLEDHLRNYQRGLPVYPTSAPKATVGGWLALNGLGVGSFEYGWLWENVALVDIVPRGGGLRTVPGDELPLVLKPGYTESLIVKATLWTTRLKRHMPFSAAFDAPEDLSQAILEIYRGSVPLWHLGLQNAAMAQVRGHERKHLLFGAYPEERAPKVEEPLWTKIESHRG